MCWTRARHSYMTYGEKPCQKIIWFDANALYFWFIAQPMPSGHYTRWLPEGNHFKPQRSSRHLADQWLDWEAHRRGIAIRHQTNATEKRMGDHRLPVAGFALVNGTPTVFQFYGCSWQGHGCKSSAGHYSERRGKTAKQLQAAVVVNGDYIKELGYHLIELWECEFHTMCQTLPRLRDFLKQQEYPPSRHRMLTTPQILDAVRTEALYGFVECDLHVPDDLKPRFTECPPIFKNAEVSRGDIGENTGAYAEEHHCLTQPRRMLTAPLVRESRTRGDPCVSGHAICTRSLFTTHANTVTSVRRQGDADPSKAIRGESMKLAANSFYVGTVTNQARHVNVNICATKQARRRINNAKLFRNCEVIDGDMYRDHVGQKYHAVQSTLQIGCMVYQIAKLRMLQFLYDYLGVYFDQSDWQLIEMDTDSAYMAVSNPDWESLVKPELQEQYEAEGDQWLPRREHYSYDKCTPGLFKLEWSGDAMISLSSKNLLLLWLWWW